MKTAEHGFLVCDECGYCCYVRGFMATGVSSSPPPCPGCSAPTRLAKREPWRDTYRSA